MEIINGAWWIFEGGRELIGMTRNIAWSTIVIERSFIGNA